MEKEINTKIFGHRGFSGKYPENTMLAFKKAVEIGVDGIEFDVQLTSDGEVVIIHDERVDRTTNGSGNVRSFTLSELKELDASATFAGQYGKNEIPTLREYFEYVKDKDIVTNIELKTGVFVYPGIEKKVIDLVKEFGLDDKIIFSSFNHETVLRCAELAPHIKRGFLTGDWIVNFGRYAEENGVQCCHPSFTTLHEENIAEMHAHGREINTWTVNECDDIKRLASLGVDCLIGNYPDRMIELLR